MLQCWTEQTSKSAWELFGITCDVFFLILCVALTLLLNSDNLLWLVLSVGCNSGHTTWTARLRPHGAQHIDDRSRSASSGPSEVGTQTLDPVLPRPAFVALMWLCWNMLELLQNPSTSFYVDVYIPLRLHALFIPIQAFFSLISVSGQDGVTVWHSFVD